MIPSKSIVRRVVRLATISLVAGAATVLVAGQAQARSLRVLARAPHAGRDSTRDSVRAADAALLGAGDDTLFGRSGKLRFRYVRPSRPLAIPILSRLFGDSAAARPGVYAVRDSAVTHPFSFITLVPFGSKVDGRVGDYRLGFWPAERRPGVSEAYENPEGFITVTADNADTRVSEHFRLRDFLTHDQHDVWPKYLVLREDLVDKLELVIGELQRSGITVRHMAVMSGFRTPNYNATGGETGGRATLSRHMYGDAADVFVDNNGDGRMDDLNHDGRVNYRDARVILRAVERVEAAHPELTGGVGVYRATHSHGPFAHVDVRGSRARWGRA